jgi:NADPH:quinone reductase-like Zn-dependent oxidoreductase
MPLMLYQMGRNSVRGLLGWGPKYTVTILQHQAAKGLVQLCRLITERKLMPTVSQTFPLAQAADAHELCEGGHVRGKVVLHVADLP